MATLETFHVAAQTHLQALMSGMLVLERCPGSGEQLEACRRAARSLRTAASLAGLDVSANLAHAMEDCFAAARRGYIELDQERIALMFRAVDLFGDFAIATYRHRSQQTAHNVDSLPRDVSAHMKHVLVVDDSPGVRDLQVSLLSASGYRVDGAADGVDAWYRLRMGEFDLVVADGDMPLFDGFRLARQIRKEPLLQALPVILAIADDSEQSKRRAFEAGADYYVVKSDAREQLARTVASLIGASEA